MAAPMATTSSGLTPSWPSLPKMSFTSRWILRHARHAADHDDLVDVGRLQLGVGQRLQHRAAALLDQVIDQLLELRARQRHLQVLRPRCVRRDERQVDVGRGLLRQVLLGPLGRFLEPLQGHLVLAQVDAVVPS